MFWDKIKHIKETPAKACQNICNVRYGYVLNVNNITTDVSEQRNMDDLWVDGEKIDIYYVFGDGSPVDPAFWWSKALKQEACVRIKGDNANQFDDTFCGDSYAFICEKDNGDSGVALQNF